MSHNSKLKQLAGLTVYIRTGIQKNGIAFQSR